MIMNTSVITAGLQEDAPLAMRDVVIGIRCISGGALEQLNG